MVFRSKWLSQVCGTASCSPVTLAGEEEKLVGNLLSVHITQLDRDVV
ncbi:hypothetical protein M5D96_009209 [Drosophila gunungcola]|uniref:Uncharacterized protein n=1 Tax=Drosophila gunungcola TaxID=103775 RepID=A0A9P9YJD4_9MUSC|nr:hypothetical protein M5D96_009209 [Drosophila gunungcola]